MWTMNFQMFKLDLEKAETRDENANIHWIIEKARELQKNIYFCFIDYAKAFDCMDHNHCGQFLKRWEFSTTWPASWECIFVCQEATVRTGHGTTDWFQIGKEYVMAVYCHCAYLTYMQSTPW